MNKALRLRLLFNFWPPLLASGIRIARLDRDWKAIDVELRLRFWNRNYVGTHYGGSLYSMTDPFYMLMLIEALGSDYIVWDKAANIRFRRPGRGTVRAKFRLTDVDLNAIREALETQHKVEPRFTVEVIDESGEIVAEVEKTLHVRKKVPSVELSRTA